MFIPLFSESTTIEERFPFATFAIVFINLMFFIVSNYIFNAEHITKLALIPANIASAKSLSDFTLVSYMFLHVDYLHLAGNMVFLWVCGTRLENDLGHVRFLIMYIASGILAGIVEVYMVPHSIVPVIGASGAVSSVVAGFLLLRARDRMWILLLRVLPIKVPAAIVLGSYVAMQILLAVSAPDTDVSWWGHVGGLASGAILVLMLRRKLGSIDETAV